MDLLRSLPIGLYLEQPISWLHTLDARVKLGWLLSFLLTPIAASPEWRLSLVGWLFLLTLLSLLPFRVWQRQLGLILLFSLLLFIVTMFAPDGITVSKQPRLPNNELVVQSTSLPANATPPLSESTPSEQPSPNSLSEIEEPVQLPQPTGYRYVLFHKGAIRITRRSLELAIRLSTLTFVLIYSTNLFLMTTAPEEITAGIDNLMQPLRRFNIPVTEIVLTLTLSLRFIPLVLEEVQNLVRSVRTRAINWKKLGFRGSMQVWTMIAERLIDNLLVRAEQIASAMQVRGFTSPNQHRVQWHQSRLRLRDWFAIVGIGVFWSARWLVGS
ncbi:energy-coupling factor transporter transmembrane component T family protein [Thermocoleostomius sinensis]|uniref:Energy-coupling factor transporter transmembrane protein EcfT n=1 Tax=Thermocoleostomius sinensis A174 TaxID=2016057 RepID=A0A9E8ZA11_9CYAN|nr:energy-coupling factor transporter transmembrane protein EcfT [Thermocoleostomius sinensis]WAL58139.1 energy-coupling factor transporter transmembrane protein EcfT [Thermocoleostomius sinensis A174]